MLFPGEDFFFAADFLAVLFFGADFLDADFLGGTLAPAFRASESPIAIACFLLVTFFPVPLLSLPCFSSCMVFSTLSCDFFEYFAIVYFLKKEKHNKYAMTLPGIFQGIFIGR